MRNLWTIRRDTSEGLPALGPLNLLDILEREIGDTLDVEVGVVMDDISGAKKIRVLWADVAKVISDRDIFKIVRIDYQS